MNTCPICHSQRREIFSAKILSQYEIKYFLCDNCGFLQTESPFWLDEAYSNAIADTDTGIVARNLSISKKLTCILYFLFNREGKYLDMAGGYGLLTRMMRDIGFDFYWQDVYCQNIFAEGFEFKDTIRPFSAVTAFEVLEHVYHPIDFIKQSLSEAETKTIIFSTELFQGTPPQPNAWDYYAHETGQHISFYQYRSLQYIARELSLNLYSYMNFHILTDKILNSFYWSLLVSRFSRVLYLFAKKKTQSKTLQDYQKRRQK